MCDSYSAATTEYEFSLYEVRPAGTNPNQVVLHAKPVYQVSTMFTQLVYGLSEPPLQEHMQYVWQMQAKDGDGRDLFRNNGYSEVCSFTYGGQVERSVFTHYAAGPSKHWK